MRYRERDPPAAAAPVRRFELPSGQSTEDRCRLDASDAGQGAGRIARAGNRATDADATDDDADPCSPVRGSNHHSRK